MDTARPAAGLRGVTLPGRPGRFDLAVSQGGVELTPSRAEGGGLVLPLLADAHVHLDKTYTVHRTPGRASSLAEAIEMGEADRAGWTAADIRARAERALDRAHRHGTGAMRSHVDWTDAAMPLAWPVLRELREEWRGRVELELAALAPVDLLAEAGAAVADAVRTEGGVLGAFAYRDTDLAEKLAGVFRLAADRGLALDFHVDEGLDADAEGFDAVVAETARHAMGGRVLAGHACALSVRPEAEARAVLARAAAAGVALCVLPTTNAHLQDARPGRTPRLRGLAPLQEARAEGVEVLIASDNCRDPFYPHGDYDLLEVYRTAVLAGHLDAAGWLGAVTAAPARLLGAAGGLADGGPADFVWFDATDIDDLIARPRARRQVWRAGAPLDERSHGPEGMA